MKNGWRDEFHLIGLFIEFIAPERFGGWYIIFYRLVLVRRTLESLSIAKRQGLTISI